MAPEEDILTNKMPIQLFSKWKVDQLKTLSAKRGVVLLGRKVELPKKVYYAWKLKLEIAKTTREEEDDASTRRREKFTIESGVSLLFLSNLKEGWEEGSLNFLDVLEVEPSSRQQRP